MPHNIIQQVIDYAHQNHQTYLESFKELLCFPSISQDLSFRPQLEACADWIVAEMQRIGLENYRKIPTAGHPIVYGDWLNAGDDKPTLVIYAHYDVQPVGDRDLWESEPFKPTIIDDRLVARGTVDDKCGIWVNLKAFESILSVHGSLPINIKFFFEGEEELGSPNVQPFVSEHKDLLTADALIICDGPFSPTQPIIGYSVRGTVIGEVTVTGPKHDLHSGRYGGAVKNPIHHIATIIDSFHDATGRIKISGFYDDVIVLTDTQLSNLNEVWQTIGEKIEQGAGVESFWGEELGTFAERTTSLPTLDVNGIHGGYWGEGTQSIIPAQAGFKVTIRVVPNQNPDTVWNSFRKHILSFADDTVKIDVKLINTAYPFVMSDIGKEIEAIQVAFEAVIGKKALLLRHGGSLPIGGLLQRELNIPTTMLGFGSGDLSHAPNEYIYVNDTQIAIDVAIRFFFALGTSH
jgi:acetylornithine deacetylase/succinyl-diaminopimelate desuccinylase-like protein